MTSLERLARASYRIVLRLHPPAQRERYGEQMTEDFLRSLREARGRGRRLTTTVAELGTLAATGMRDRLTGLGSRSGPWSTPLTAVIRAARARPGHTAALVGTLALGIGVWLPAWVVLDATLLRRDGSAEVGELAEVWTYFEERENDGPGVALAVLPELRGADDLFQAAEAVLGRTAVLSDPGLPEQIAVYSVTPGMLDLVGVRPARGIGLGASGAGPDPALVSHDLWIRKFGGDGGAVGSTVTLGGERRTIVGIMPRGFNIPGFGRINEPAVWVPLLEGDSAAARANTVVRLRAGLELETAIEAFETRAPELARAAGLAPGTRPQLVDPLFFGLPDWAASTVWILAGAAGVILLVAAINAVALVITRSLDHREGWAVRGALGASRARLVVGFATEGAVLGVLAGGAGAFLASGLLTELVERIPSSLRLSAFGRTLGLEGGEWLAAVLLGAAIAAAAAGLGAWLGTAGDRGLGQHSRGASEGRGTRRLRVGLAVLQAALSFVLLAGGGLLLNTLVRLARVDTGFDVDRVLVATLRPPTTEYATPAEREALYAQVAEALRTVPGVVALSQSSGRPPLPSSGAFRPVLERDDGSSVPLDDILPYFEVDPAFFEAAGVRLLEGRAFPEIDAEADPVVIGERLARRLWPDGGAIGRTLRIREEEPRRTVVGIAADVVSFDLRDPAAEGMEFFLPLAREGDRERSFVVRGASSGAALVEPLRARMREVDPALPFSAIAPLSESYRDGIDRQRFAALVVGSLAAFGLLVSAVGLYGLLAHQVRSRTRDIGIRQTLGARPRHLLAQIFATGLGTAAVGVGLGTGVALLSFDALEALLHGVGTRDTPTLVVAGAVFLLVSAAASLIPGLRAMRIDPALSTRAE